MLLFPGVENERARMIDGSHNVDIINNGLREALTDLLVGLFMEIQWGYSLWSEKNFGENTKGCILPKEMGC